jgi:cellobiose-specific phosphotransferase system component IIA
MMDKRKTKEEVASMGGEARHGVSKAQDCAKQKSSDQTAQTLRISARKVEQARTVMDHGDEKTK